MIKVIAGLGNPGSQYQATRHNAGFQFLEQMAPDHWQHLGRYNTLSNDLTWQGYPVQLLKPLSFMNLSGGPITAYLRYYRLPIESLLVVHDELDLDPGVIRYKFAGGHGGHKGLKDLHSKLGSPKYHRLRIGIGHPGSAPAVVNYVLGRPDPGQRQAILSAMDRGLQALPDLLAGHFEQAMNTLHAPLRDTSQGAACHGI